MIDPITKSAHRTCLICLCGSPPPPQSRTRACSTGATRSLPWTSGPFRAWPSRRTASPRPGSAGDGAAAPLSSPGGFTGPNRPSGEPVRPLRHQSAGGPNPAAVVPGRSRHGTLKCTLPRVGSAAGTPPARAECLAVRILRLCRGAVAACWTADLRREPPPGPSPRVLCVLSPKPHPTLAWMLVPTQLRAPASDPPFGEWETTARHGHFAGLSAWNFGRWPGGALASAGGRTCPRTRTDILLAGWRRPGHLGRAGVLSARPPDVWGRPPAAMPAAFDVTREPRTARCGSPARAFVVGSRRAAPAASRAQGGVHRLVPDNPRSTQLPFRYRSGESSDALCLAVPLRTADDTSVRFLGGKRSAWKRTGIITPAEKARANAPPPPPMLSFFPLRREALGPFPQPRPPPTPDRLRT